MVRNVLILIVIAGVLTSCGFKRKKYENPISKDTKQPDKVLFDKAINDIEHGRYEVARITLNTLINTYDQSEFLAKAKLAIADSWFREGGAHGLSQAEAEYKDFILFYPTMEEAAESQEKVCMIHYKQMDKADRDPTQALRAEDECRQLLVQFPNSKHSDETRQLLRNIQEALGDAEFRVGEFYHKKGSNPAAANRLSRLADQYPLYSHSDEALWDLADSYSRMGPRFRKQAGEAYARIVKEYPLSDYVEPAKKKLNELEFPIPEVDPAAYARMKYNDEHKTRRSMMSKSTALLHSGPDVDAASKTGDPAMTTLRPTVPASVPQAPGAAGGFSGDVTATTVSGASALDTKPDARQNPPAAAAGASGDKAAATPAAGAATPAPAAAAADNTQNQPLPTNANYQQKAKKKKKTKNPPADQQQQQQPQPASTTPPAPNTSQQ
jgi:outer membrane protein assembly factor BamD